MVRCVLFDFDGTVFDTVEGITKSVQYAARKQGLDPELSELRRFAGPPLVDMFMEHFGFDRAAAEQAVVDFRERYNPIGLYECRIFPGVKEALLQLRRRGYLVGIATSKPQMLAEELLGREDMLPLFDGIVGSSADGNNNSKADVLRRAMGKKKPEVRPENEGRVIYETNGNCAPYRVILFAAAEGDEEGPELMTVHVSRSGKVTIGDEEDERRR